MDMFDPAKWTDTEQEHLWWTWVTDAQLKQSCSLGTISGYKNVLHGYRAHHHHRFHNNTTEQTNLPDGLATIRCTHPTTSSVENGLYSSSICFRRGEKISIEFVPNHLEAQPDNPQEQEAAMFEIKNTMGHPIGVWNIDEWQRIDNEGAATIWLDHSISA
eukprot:2146150-Amphidinium_carterae.1